MDKQRATEPSSGLLTTSRPSIQLSRWIGEELTVLAEAFGEHLTEARLKIYVADLAPLGQEVLASVFARARRECRFFPKIAELLELAGLRQSDIAQIEANTAWEEVLAYSRNNWHPDLGHHGKASLSPRCEYAVRHCGGLPAIFNRTVTSEPFLRKRFDDAYRLAPAAAAAARTRLAEVLKQEPLLTPAEPCEVEGE